MLLLLSDERLLVPPNSDRVAELPDTPGGETSITRYVPHTYIGVFLSVFRGSPQLVLTAVESSREILIRYCDAYKKKKEKSMISTVEVQINYQTVPL